ncbi:MAG: hypothetical protein QM660_14345 [Dysgonomonas sp.]
MGTVEGVYYSGGNSVLAFKHEPFHVGDNDDDRYTVSTGLSNSQLNWLEGRAVGFQTILVIYMVLIKLDINMDRY